MKKIISIICLFITAHVYAQISAGSIPYAVNSFSLGYLPIGTPGQVLGISGSTPTWTTSSGGATYTVSSPATLTSGTVISVQDASASQSGVWNTTSQTLPGDKTYTGNATFGGNTTYSPVVNNSLSGANQRIPSHSSANIVFTNAGLTSIASANNGGVSGGHTIMISNQTGASISIVNSYSAAAAGESILTGTDINFTLANNGVIWLNYNSTASAWEVMSGGIGGTYLNFLGYNVLTNGIVADGTTDIGPALSTLLNTTAATGSTIIFPPGNYVWNTNVTISNKYFNIMGFGAVITTTANITLLTVSSTTNTADGWGIRNLTFTGNNTGASQEAIRFKKNVGFFNIYNCAFNNFNFAAVEIDSTNITSFYSGGISNCTFSNNNGRGIYLGSRGEYVRINNCEINGNGTGIYSIAGNSITDACNINHNTKGVDFEAGTNNGHSIISNCNINHNTSYGVLLKNQTLGMTLSDCHLYSDSIRVDTCTGVIINGGSYDPYKWIFNGNTNCALIGIYYPNGNSGTASITGTSPSVSLVYGTAPTGLTDQFGGTWVDYSSTSTVLGWSGTPTKNIRYLQQGKNVIVEFSITGTSNATTASFTIPFTSNTNQSIGNQIFAQDNGASRTTGAVAWNNSNSATVNLFTDWALTSGWTNTGTKWVLGRINIRIP